ncbi:hypothetical protein PNOK_0903900 [Pyrrhoderma noxium]|uniref:Uncharacterized protein n=1 Tax=Pyrrhoderma noxium TaxID=2282107 RepID=A0A286U6R9_9AGAM|nr:hypothetical protein PNOK_0903900 [Pyrrhoderma noxium]
MFGTSCDRTSSNIELSSTETGNMSQAQRDRDHNDTIPTPFRLPRLLANPTVRDLPLLNKTTKSRATYQSITTLEPNVGNGASVGQSSNVDRDDLREEVNNLRMEIERMREGTALPSYRS